MMTPIVTIFVRHSADCRYKGDEFHKSCRCAKHLRWSYGGKQYRRAAKTRSWAIAEQAKKRVEAQFETGANPASAINTVVPVSKPTITKAKETFIAGKRNQGLTEKLVNKFVLELGRFDEFMEKRSKFFPSEITLEDLE